MAWLMAELSRLAYFPFEGGHQIEKFLSIARELIDDNALYQKLSKLADSVLTGHKIGQAAARAAFERILTVHGFKLIGTFNINDTQGFVAQREGQAFLIYRGTESFGDVKADINARLIEVTHLGKTVKVHQGFWQQFIDVDTVVRTLLEQVKDCQLHIGGHSLGGALANLATKFYASDTAGSTYTFGAPAVSLPSFQDDIKTPIYRIVNARDPVPLLPNPMLAHALSFLWYYAQRFLGFIGSRNRQAFSEMLRDMRQMGQIGYHSRIIYVAGEPKLRYSFGIYDRLILWWQEPWFNWRLEDRFVSYHKIARYVEALRKWGEQRNNG
jgi:hypothetical protein